MTIGSPAIAACRVRVRGLVQGVGFRPFVWRLAHEEGLTGYVLNDAEGVLIEAAGPPGGLERLLVRLSAEAPMLARVDCVDAEPVPAGGWRDFTITASRSGAISTGIVADAATCGACLAEIRDPSNRRYRYPFANCTHCGPRLSITRGIPYDRSRTSMSAFPMCADCRREYEDPADRRFHAQPIACPACGPRLWLEDARGEIASADPLAQAAALIGQGAILAIKGLGGFHLACDATSAGAVVELRRRKARPAKPLALMVRDLAMARRLAQVSAAEAELMASPAAPILLLERRPDAPISAGIAPGQGRIGLMLPYTPLHHVLMDLTDRPLVMTSANRSSEPQCVTNGQARERLAAIADHWLMHDRDILNRLDDAVLRLDRTGRLVLRRARGYAPAPMVLPAGFGDGGPVLALGGELKSTFCILRRGETTLSQHLGDLEDAHTLREYHATLALYRSLLGVVPALIAVDAHPGYVATSVGEALARETGARLVAVQHHHAHLAACLAENGIDLDRAERAPVLGIVLDGAGFGSDGSIWGGELLYGGYRRVRRVGHLAPVPLPGGERAMREPWRNTYAHLRAAFGPDWRAMARGCDFAASVEDRPLALLERAVARGVNAPLASSAGRLFDAVAGLLGICRAQQTYEGQAAMELEALAAPCMPDAPAYAFTVPDRVPLVPDLAPMWRAMVDDVRSGAPAGVIAARFHHTLSEVLVIMAGIVARRDAITVVALSGGVMQNRLLADGLEARLAGAGFDVLRHRRTPANDGGLALGQAVVAAAQVAGAMPGTKSPIQ